MAENAEAVAADKVAAKKGRAKSKKPIKKAPSDKEKAESVRQESVTAQDELMKSIREQVENCKEEIRYVIRKDMAAEFRNIVGKELAKANRRRRWNNFFRDVIIILLTVVAVYFGYCLYDAHYFNFMKSDCERAGNCEISDSNDSTTAGPIKDATWYLANYSYLFDNIQTKLSADNLAVYYLYTDDHKVSEIAPEYLLSMAYNQVENTSSDEQGMIEVSNEAMSQAFRETFGSTEHYVPTDFMYDCLKFAFSRSSNNFISENKFCESDQKREIIEKIDRIYEEGEVIYIATVAAVRDKTTMDLYNFDNLFKPVAVNASSEDFTLHTGSLNRYQYQFKKSGDNYYLASIVKLK